MAPDPVYNSVLVHQLINKLMLDGKKSLAQSIVYGAFDLIQERTGEEPTDVLDKAVRNVMPVLGSAASSGRWRDVPGAVGGASRTAYDVGAALDRAVCS